MDVKYAARNVGGIDMKLDGARIGLVLRRGDRLALGIGEGGPREDEHGEGKA